MAKIKGLVKNFYTDRSMDKVKNTIDPLASKNGLRSNIITTSTRTCYKGLQNRSMRQYGKEIHGFKKKKKKSMVLSYGACPGS